LATVFAFCAKKRNSHKGISKSAPACFGATFRVSRTVYQLFYDGEEPPELPNLPKRKSADDIAFGSSGKEARFLSKFRRLLGKVEEGDRRLLLYMAQKMASR